MTEHIDETVAAPRAQLTETGRPVVALDVDGVLNTGPGPGHETHELYVPAAEVPNSYFIRGHGQADLRTTVCIDPGHGSWITRLREHADVVWATTWEHLANDYLAPLLGIDPLPVAVSTEAHPPRFGYVKNGDAAAWKAEVLEDLYWGRPLVWIDDQNGSYTYGQGNRDSFGRPAHPTPAAAGFTTHPFDLDDEYADDDDLTEDLDDVAGAARNARVRERLLTRLRREDPWWPHLWRGQAPTLAVCTDPVTGLTPDIRARVDAFVRHHRR